MFSTSLIRVSTPRAHELLDPIARSSAFHGSFGCATLSGSARTTTGFAQDTVLFIPAPHIWPGLLTDRRVGRGNDSRLVLQEHVGSRRGEPVDIQAA
jgi:hypothetical protein